MKKILFVIGLVFILLASGCTTPNPGQMTYDKCVEQLLAEGRIFGPAQNEPVGATREDKDGNVWVKQEDGMWTTDATNTFYTALYKPDVNVSIGEIWIDENGIEWIRVNENEVARNVTEPIKTRWGNILIDEQPGGARYEVDLTECFPYKISEIEAHLNQTVNNEIERLAQEGISISVYEIKVISGQGWVALNCDSLDYEKEGEMFENIAIQLIASFPEEFGEEGRWFVDVRFSCGYKMGWRITEGHYSMMY